MSTSLPIQIASAVLAVTCALVVSGCTVGDPNHHTGPAPSPGVEARGGAVDASADRIVFSRATGSGDPVLWTADPDGRAAAPVGEQTGFFPDWSPDRSRILFDFFDSDGIDQIATIRPDGTGFAQLTSFTETVYNEAADYSPDGSTIVFDRAFLPETDPAFTTTLWVMDADGANPRPLLAPTDAGFDFEAEFSPDGSRIVFVRCQPATTSCAVHSASATGTDVQQLSPFSVRVEHPHWSPDGSHLIFNIENATDLQDPINGIYTVPASGSVDPKPVLLSTPETHVYKPDYSPNGERIVFGCARSANEQHICTMDADGTDIERITGSTEIDNDPLWD